MPARLTQEEFINRSNTIHNNKYDYSLVNYTNKDAYVKIICPIHGVFETIANSHMRGCECIECYWIKSGNEKRKTTEQFIIDAKLIHGDTYIYSNANNIGNKKPITITCKIHGDFTQTPQNHLKGAGCKKCALDNRKTTEKFINEAIKKHGDTYNYSKTEYIDIFTKVTITCKKHGDFKQNPRLHLDGRGCWKCSVDLRFKGLTKTTEKFIADAKLVHGDMYTYDKVEYVNSRTIVIITCPIHGDFKQTPSSHIGRKSGCQICGLSKGEKEIKKKLDDFGVNYIRQMRFKDCRGKTKPLPFDFYLPEHNILIEFDGSQHYFNKGKLWGGEDGLKTRQKNDAIKTQYCLDNNIKLIRIRYDESIEERLKEIFS